MIIKDSLHQQNPDDVPMIAIAAEDLAKNPNKSARYMQAVDATVARVMAAIANDIAQAVEKSKK